MAGPSWWRNAAPTIIFLALALAPLASVWLGQAYALSLLTRAVALALAAMSLDLLIGYAGLVSFGHAAFVGIGAYATGILAVHGLGEAAVQLGVVVGAATLFSLATGVFTLRTEGVHYIMISLAFGQMLFFLATSLAAYGGDDGLTLPARSTVFGAPLLRSDAALYYLALGCLAGGYLAGRVVVASRYGRVLQGSRDNPRRMAAIGFDPFPYRMIASLLAGVAAAIAGFLLANQTEFVSPAIMTWQRSGELIFMVVLGGAGSLHGAILGALAFVLLEEVLSRLTEHWRMIFGPLLIGAVLFRGRWMFRLSRRVSRDG